MPTVRTQPAAFDTFSHHWLGGFRRRAEAELERATDGRDPLTYYAGADAAMTFDAVWEAVEAGSTFKIADIGVSAGPSLAN